ncbi:MAG: 4'-phosphopantetheinyl transferase superfamily protein [Oscillatoria sp. SIO1A7]|nr:4'-phosphopantetheinyl transferase superfamily protein [Oscillatoria sp. SIO1A7]
MSLDNFWQPAPTELSLSPDEAQIWRANLDLSPDRIALLREILSGEEQKRADRFYFERDQNHFIAARGILRTILGRYLSIQAEDIQFAYSDSGKPFLANTDSSLQFNLSHSHGLALYGITRDIAIGIDLEYIRPIEAEELAKRFFAPEEYSELSQLPGDRQAVEFFHYWTCKEAYLKATGAGLAGGLETVAVSFDEEQYPKLLATPGNPPLSSSWSLTQIYPGSGYAAAVAIAAASYRLSGYIF